MSTTIKPSSQQFSKPLVPLKVENGSLLLHLVTIPGRVGSGWLTSYYKADSVKLQMQLHTGTEQGNRG